MPKNGFYIAMFIVTIIDIILFSIYPVFNNATMTFAGLTMFYFYQIIMLIVSTVLFVAVSLIFKR
ncbi:hypothetical protein [Sulfolobus acidocaldarius]|uniref:Uncharacterized protein n=5 Tax=Sulfolobus acidocaldarius TaxID=2285 RepID=A0A0U3H3D3_9CREN|nr:hypothetical protein [Sulfolobus acidocaldarius]AAY79798.1 hypothetical membrane protein [Sulfolobus acidocaldarius DSM 639]AGE70356.1 hypothetical protein SacN8_01875 [Sulfolobus acidocaldarius N8]AGE72631.1 hypothetical protein SacRon12I_01875 [Sulfolobus acidocaldarius Ron12/I]ALU29245.1 hypothetical protein ATY89_04375 [Sulfolobus acidocaldarius]ALU31974.1 hypothetical protein ATZ20_07400 [Sulfolobus acidocaldarius]